jgi:hypothetical protein
MAPTGRRKFHEAAEAPADALPKAGTALAADGYLIDSAAPGAGALFEEEVESR